MNKDFILITGHGVFPASSLIQIVPVTEVDFHVEVLRPDVYNQAEFTFNLLKRVTVNLDVMRISPVKKGETENLTDYGYTRGIEESFSFELSEVISLFSLEDNEEFNKAIKDYHRRAKKVAEYNAALALIESNPDLPDYAASLSAIKHSAPSDSTERKQQKAVTKIQAAIQEAINTIMEGADEDTDETKDSFISIVNSEESQDAVEELANKVLRKFYAKNFGDGFEDDDEEDEFDDITADGTTVDESDDAFFDTADGSDNDSDNALDISSLSEEARIVLEQNAAEAVTNAEAIKSNPDTITNK
jgi:hypothetical protein